MKDRMIKSMHVRWIASSVCFVLALTFAGIEMWPTPTQEDSPQEIIELACDEANDDTIDIAQAPEVQLEEDELIQVVNLTVGSGDTLAKLLKECGASSQDIHKLSRSMLKTFKPRHIKPGQEIEVTMEKEQPGDVNPVLKEFRIRPDMEYEVCVTRLDSGAYETNKTKANLVEERRYAEAKIEGSLFQAANRYGVPNRIVQEMIQALSYDLDFQRHVKSGDSFGVLYSVMTDPASGKQRPGKLLHATLHAKGKPHIVYRFESRKGQPGYYNEKGQSIRKGLLKTPVDGARISSHFGRRKHPILGYTKAHKGVDFACPRGTPIMAAGDGKIELLGRRGGYGNYIRIKHSNGYKTAYAHLNRYAKGLKAGSYVTQGQVIGYVGTTGRSTGPHLHYEVLTAANVQINPLGVKVMPAAKLTGKQHEEFMRVKKTYDQQYAKLKETTTLAEANQPTHG